jgi:hypothetical protein
MAKRFKDFGAGNVVEADPLSFKLFDEDFYCVPQVPGKLLLEIAAQAGEDGSGSSASIIPKFFSKVLTDESFVRFDALLDSKDKIVNVETLGEIVGWLMEEYTNRPEAQPESS